MPNFPKAPGEDLPEEEAGEGAWTSGDELLSVRGAAAGAVSETLEVSEAEAAAFAAAMLYRDEAADLLSRLGELTVENALSQAAPLLETAQTRLIPLARLILSGAFSEHPDLLPEEQVKGAKCAVFALSKMERELRILESRMLVHDANNMMSAIVGPLSLLELGIRIPESLKYIADGAKGLRGLITPHEGKTLKDVFALLEPGASLQVGIPFEVVGDLELQPTLSAPRLGRVLYNLMKNAANAGAKKVTLFAQNFDGKMVLTVKDDGPGFGGVEPIKTREEADQTGHGNALQIALQFCELSGGSLTHGDLEQAGAEWVIELPLKN